MKEICLKFQCKNCRKYLLCFGKETCNENRENKNRKIKTSGIQSKKRSKTRRRRISKNKKERGHQRLNILKDLRYKEIECVGVD